MRLIFLSILALFYMVLAIKADDDSWWTHEMKVNSGLQIKWNVQDPVWITIEMSAPTQGYLGVGFSPTGSMAGSDIIFGWVDDHGVPHLHDYHGTHNGAPVLDEQQDIERLEYSQTSEGTRFRFRRKWDTCDHQDIPIEEDTMKFIWAVSSKDPNNGQLHYHTDRGVRSIFMKHHQKSRGFPDEDPSYTATGEVKHWDIKMDKYNVPAVDTLYQCKIFRFPKLEKEHHLIAHRPLFQEGNENNIHHINVFRCHVPEGIIGKTTTEIFEPYLDHPGAECYSDESPIEWRTYCFALQLAVSVGSEGDILPSELGDPIEYGPDGFTYLKLEMHYDNPHRKNFLDSSGIRMFYTDKLRPMEISMLFAGHRRTPFMTIPPGQKDFKITGFCSSDCTSKGIPSEGVTLYSVLLHAHLRGRKIILRHIRNGAELKPIAVDKHYDFSYQQYRTMDNQVKIMPGDELIVECDFDTEKDGFVLGGLSTRREMCEVFIQYYPKAELIDCRSQPEMSSYLQPLDLELNDIHSSQLQKLSLPLECENIPAEKRDIAIPDDAYVLEYGKGTESDGGDIFENIQLSNTRRYRNMYYYMQNLSWQNHEFTKNTEEHWAKGPHYMYCAAKGGRKIHAGSCVKHIKPFKPHQEPTRECLKSSASRIVSIGFLSTVFSTWFLFGSYV